MFFFDGRISEKLFLFLSTRIKGKGVVGIGNRLVVHILSPEGDLKETAYIDNGTDVTGIS